MGKRRWYLQSTAINFLGYFFHCTEKWETYCRKPCKEMVLLLADTKPPFRSRSNLDRLEVLENYRRSISIFFSWKWIFWVRQETLWVLDTRHMLGRYVDEMANFFEQVCYSHTQETAEPGHWNLTLYLNSRPHLQAIVYFKTRSNLIITCGI